MDTRAPHRLIRETAHDRERRARSGYDRVPTAARSVKSIQRMLGHASAAMTLDRYADLFDDDLDAVAERLDAVYARATRISGDVIQLAANES